MHLTFTVYCFLRLIVKRWSTLSSSDFLEVFCEGLAFSIPYPRTHKVRATHPVIFLHVTHWFQQAALKEIRYYLMQIQNDKTFKGCHFQLSIPSLTQDEGEVVVTPPMYHLLVHPNASVKVTMIRLVALERKECAAQTDKSPLRLRDTTSISMTRLESKDHANQTERPLSSFKPPSTPQSQSRSSISRLVAGTSTDS